MIRAEQIPDEVVEAGARTICVGDGRDPEQLVYLPVASGDRPRRIERWNAYKEEARAAIAAAINAWPGAEVAAWYHADQTLILPLPQEPRDE